MPSSTRNRRGHLQRGSQVVLGQSLSTMSNGLFALAVATTVSVDTYGSFAMSYTVLGPAS